MSTPIAQAVLSPIKSNAANRAQKSKKSQLVDINKEIQAERESIKSLFKTLPGFTARAKDAPQILKLVRAAVQYVNDTPAEILPKTFIYYDKPYFLRYSNLGTVFVCDAAHEVIGASAYFAVD